MLSTKSIAAVNERDGCTLARHRASNPRLPIRGILRLSILLSGRNASPKSLETTRGVLCSGDCEHALFFQSGKNATLAAHAATAHAAKTTATTAKNT